MWRPNLHQFFTRSLKGQTWQVEEMLKLFLVIIVFGGAVVLVIAATGGLTSVLNDFCEKNPEWCGASDTEDMDYKIAKTSVQVLVDAINCLADPANCVISSAGKEYDPNNQPVSVSGDIEEPIDDRKISFSATEGTGGEPLKNTNVLRARCVEGSCFIENFQLPQDLETEVFGVTLSPKEWIDGFGDPGFITYWQTFPDGEQAAWTSRSTWVQGMGTIVLWAIPLKSIGKIFGIGKKSVRVTEEMPAYKKYFQKITDKITGKLKVEANKVTHFVYDKTLGKAARLEVFQSFWRNRINKKVVEEMSGDFLKYKSMLDTEKVIIEGTEGLLEREFRAVFRGGDSTVDLMKYIKPSEAKTSILRRIGLKDINWEVLNTYAKRAGYISIAAYLGAKLDSENDKLVDREKNFVLKMPFKEAEIFNLKSLAIRETFQTPYGLGMPVVLEDTETTAYLASPCRTDLTIRTGDVVCDGYLYNKETGKVVCNVKNVGSSDQFKKCGYIDQTAIPNDKSEVFFDTDNNGKTDKIILDSGLEEKTYYDRIELKDTNSDGIIDIITQYGTTNSPNNIDWSIKHSSESEQRGDVLVRYFEFTDKDGDGEYEYKYIDFSGSTAIAYKDEKGDGNYEKDEGENNQVTGAIGYESETGSYIQMIGYISTLNEYSAEYSRTIPGSYGESVGPFFIYDYENDGRWDRVSTASMFYEDINDDGNIDIAYSTFKNKDYQCFDNTGYGGKCLGWTRGTKTSVETNGPDDSSFYCTVPAIIISVDKSNYDDDPNFCYSSKKEGVGLALIIGSLVVDGVLEYFSAGMLTHVAVGITTGAIAYANTLYHEWP